MWTRRSIDHACLREGGYGSRPTKCSRLRLTDAALLEILHCAAADVKNADNTVPLANEVVSIASSVFIYLLWFTDGTNSAGIMNSFESEDYDGIHYKKARRKRQKILIVELFLDFAKNTTLHGLRYITEKGLTTLEKVFWLITFLLSLGLCSYLISDVYHKWQNSPVIVTINERFIPTTEVPLPSVTICPRIKSARSIKFLTKHKKLNNETLEEIDESEFEDVKIICHETGENRISSNVTTDRLFVKDIYKVSPSFNVFKSCSLRGLQIACSKMFVKVLTNKGVCFNYNALSYDQILRTDVLQKNYTYLTRRKIHTPSYEGLVVGRENLPPPDIDVIFNERKPRDPLCNSSSKGFKVYLQHQTDMPQSFLSYYAVVPNQVTSLAVKLNIFNTSDEMKEYKSDVRQCYYPHERTLRYFKIYTLNNCRLECQTDYTYKMCNCVYFNMPFNNSSAVCRLKDRPCVSKAISKLVRQEVKSKVEELAGPCNCLPPCENVQYDADLLRTGFDYKSYTKIEKILNNNTLTYRRFLYSKLEIYYKEPRFISMRRSELFGITSFLANIGGLLGLFLGFSFLSLVEIIYFITLRLFCTLKRDLREEKVARRESTKRYREESGY